MNLDLSKNVKFKNQISEFEAKTIYEIKNYNEVTQRVYISPINMGFENWAIRPQSLASINDLQNL